MNSDAWNMKRLASVAEAHGFSLKVTVGKLSDDAKHKILYGTGDQKYRVDLGGGRHYDTTYEGVIPNLERRWKELIAILCDEILSDLCARGIVMLVKVRA